MEEGLFYADDLPETDQRGFAALQAYVKHHRAEVEPGSSEVLELYSRSKFVKRVFYQVAYKARALVVGFNLLFDLSRLATRAAEARGRDLGGFSFQLWDRRDPNTGQLVDSLFRPRLIIIPQGQKKAFIKFGRTRHADVADTVPEGQTVPNPRYRFRGRFLDLKTLVHALTNENHTLASTGEAFGIPHGKARVGRHGLISSRYIDYNRRDVLATQQLLERLREELDQHPVALLPDRAYSPASLAKSYLDAMGITPLQRRSAAVKPRHLGAAMSAYFGGRTECRIRRVPVPVTYTDFLSMYPTVNSLMELWQFFTADHVEVEDATTKVRKLLRSVTPEASFEKNLWKQLTFFAQVLPAGDILPTRSQYAVDGAYTIGVNPLTSALPLWYAGPDLIASTILTGRPPKVLAAFRIVARGKLRDLTPTSLRGAVRIDPVRDDFFRRIVEERRSISGDARYSPRERQRLVNILKTLANSGSYGILAELNRRELPLTNPAKVSVYGGRGVFPTVTHALEEPGRFFYPPLASLITAGARLMLALLERSITDLGGTWAFCDTDSMAIVATRRGGLVACPGGPHQLPNGRAAIRALAWADVDAIVDRFGALNPYARAAVPGSILKIEAVNLDDTTQARRELGAFTISAKRYALSSHE